MFKNTPKDHWIRTGVFSIYFSFPFENTSMSIHRDHIRTTAINLDISGCSGGEVWYYHSKSGSTAQLLTEDDAECVEKVLIEPNLVFAMDAHVHHNIPKQFMTSVPQALLSYGWYDTSANPGYSKLYATLMELDLLK